MTDITKTGRSSNYPLQYRRQIADKVIFSGIKQRVIAKEENINASTLGTWVVNRREELASIGIYEDYQQSFDYPPTSLKKKANHMNLDKNKEKTKKIISAASASEDDLQQDNQRLKSELKVLRKAMRIMAKDEA